MRLEYLLFVLLLLLPLLLTRGIGQRSCIMATGDQRGVSKERIFVLFRFIMIDACHRRNRSSTGVTVERVISPRRESLQRAKPPLFYRTVHVPVDLPVPKVSIVACTPISLELNYFKETLALLVGEGAGSSYRTCSSLSLNQSVHCRSIPVSRSSTGIGTNS